MPNTDDRRVRPFADWLQEFNNGITHNDLSTALRDLLEAVLLHGKPGSLSLNIKIKPAGRDQQMVLVTHNLTAKSPEPDQPESYWYTDRDGNLTRNYPTEEVRLPLQAVPAPTPPYTDGVRDADRTTGEIR